MARARTPRRDRSSTATARPPKMVVTYESLDVPPQYVEGVQGLLTAKEAVQMYFFTDYIMPPATLEPETTIKEAGQDTLTVNVDIRDPYGMQSGEIHVTRRIEANLILSVRVLRELRDWADHLLQQAQEGAAKRQPA